MPFTFDAGSFRRFSAQIGVAQKTTLEIATRAAEIFAETAERVMIEVMTQASTPTGEARVARGGSGPGRINTGALIKAILADLEREGRSVTGRAGWLEDQQDYYLIQDQSARYGAHALEQGFIAGRNAAIEYIEREWRKL